MNYPLRRATVVGTGMYAPKRVVKNEFFNELYKKDIDTFLREQRNMFERHYMEPEQATSDLIVPAAEEAMKNAGITAKDLDLIIVATDTPDYVSPSTAAVVQYKLQATYAGTFDVNSACAGFVAAMDIASKYISADAKYKNILVVGAYGMTKYLNPDDYKISTLFGDGASAAILQPSKDSSGVLAAELYTDGQYHDYMGIYAGGTHQPITHSVVENKGHLLNFAKKIPIETNGTHWPRLTHTLLDRIHRHPEDVKHFFLTQININSINEAMDNLKLPRRLSHNVMDRYGYTGSAAVGMCMADAVRQHKLKKGDLIILLGSGGGLSMAALALEWGYNT
ncbi:MAG: ketoacyl-ACP synthase III [Bdellovibrio sp. CG10_big_fil_rev_8_21_14_0_10_47_8]|nr:MAG: ketoacyl-ACP synthase III [Bdellovibrio sp. CG10_big_fil_rev_8_21_14_0_10_47_8]